MNTPKIHVLYVEVSASTDQLVAEMVDQLARAACDIVNNTDDEHAHIGVWDDDRGEDSQLPIHA